MSISLEDYKPYVGEGVCESLKALAEPLKGKHIVHVNSTRAGGGVAEILNRMTPLMNALGLICSWEVIEGSPAFYACTKSFHNAIQGASLSIPQECFLTYEAVNRDNAKKLHAVLQEADFVMIHDPQPLALINYFPDRTGKWMWRCHIDASSPDVVLWDYLQKSLESYDATIFTLPEYGKELAHPVFFIPPSIDPLTDKNKELPQADIDAVFSRYGINPHYPFILQVSRFDRFKDPVGVIHAYQLVKKHYPHVQLVLAGGTADDDPEGAEVFQEMQAVAKGDPDIKALLLPPDAHLEINALQRAATVVIQKSLKEGFGLTVTEALWKGKAVVGGDTPGIRLQVIEGKTGFLVDSIPEAAFAIQKLLAAPELGKMLGKAGREWVREKFLITRQIAEYIEVMRFLC